MRIAYHCVCGGNIEVEAGSEVQIERANKLLNSFIDEHSQCLSKTWEERTFYRTGHPTEPITKAEVPF